MLCSDNDLYKGYDIRTGSLIINEQNNRIIKQVVIMSSCFLNVGSGIVKYVLSIFSICHLELI